MVMKNFNRSGDHLPKQVSGDINFDRTGRTDTNNSVRSQ